MVRKKTLVHIREVLKKIIWMDIVHIGPKTPPPPNCGLCFFSPLFYHSFPIFIHKKKREKWTRPETPPIFLIFFKTSLRGGFQVSST